MHGRPWQRSVSPGLGNGASWHGCRHDARCTHLPTHCAFAAVAAAAATLAAAILKIGALIGKEINNDRVKRDMFARNMVNQMVAQYPDYNVMVVAVGWKIYGHFTVRQQVKCTYSGGGWTAYDVLMIRQGDYAYFERLVDGCWINWAFTCPPEHCVVHGNTP